MQAASGCSSHCCSSSFCIRSAVRSPASSAATRCATCWSRAASSQSASTRPHSYARSASIASPVSTSQATRPASYAPASPSAAAGGSRIGEASALTFCGRLRKMRATAAARGSSTMLSSYSREALKKVSSATLTTVLFKRGLRNVFIQGVFLLNRDSPRMVGEAFTLRYIPAREDIDQLGAFEGRGHPQREAIEACPPGHVLMMDARRDASAATGGDILMTRLMVRGTAGIVTDGGLRDSTTIEKLDFPVYCGARSAPLNLVRHHAIDAQVPIGCGGVAVYPGDVLVGGGEGVVAVPAKKAGEGAEEAEAQTQFEDWVEIKVKEGRGIFG